jgi:uncharacterized membrane protein YhdT
MHRTPKHPNPVLDRIRLPMEVLGWFVAAYTAISAGIKVFLHITSWIAAMEMATSVMLALIGLAMVSILAIDINRRSDRAQKASRLFFPVGVGLSLMALALPTLAMGVAGLSVCLGLLVPAYLIQEFRARRYVKRSVYPTGWRRPSALFRCRMVPALGLVAAIAVYGVAVGASLPHRSGRTKKNPPGSGSTKRGGSRPKKARVTYETNCPKLPNPLEIGHGMGKLFRRDGAVKAGCGSKATEMTGTSTWISVGMCGSELRSIAISGPEGEPSIVYGEAATFAWEAAEQGELAGAEARSPAGGDFDVVWTIFGTFAFVRAHQEQTQGNSHPTHCDEVGGEPEPFVELVPPLFYFWKTLVAEKTEWLWPTRDESGTNSAVAFIGPSGETVATGECATSETCRVAVEGRDGHVDGSAFLHISDLEPFVPAEESGDA